MRLKENQGFVSVAGREAGKNMMALKIKNSKASVPG